MTTMTVDDIKNFSAVAAAIIALIGSLITLFLVWKKEKRFEKQRQQFSLQLQGTELAHATKLQDVELTHAKQLKDVELAHAKQLKSTELAHAEKLQDERHDFEKEKQVLLEAQNKLNHLYAQQLQQQKAELDAWKTGYEIEIAARNDALRKLRTAVITLFDHFQNMLQLALRADDQEILGVLARCVQALSNLDKAIDAAKSIVRNDIEAEKLHRLHIIKRFFLRVILDLTRRKTERLSQAPALRKMESRLKKRKEVTMLYLQSVMEERPRAPGIGVSK